MNTRTKKKDRPSGHGNIPVLNQNNEEVPRKNDDTARQAEVLDTRRTNTEFDHRKSNKP